MGRFSQLKPGHNRRRPAQHVGTMLRIDAFVVRVCPVCYNHGLFKVVYFGNGGDGHTTRCGTQTHQLSGVANIRPSIGRQLVLPVEILTLFVFESVAVRMQSVENAPANAFMAAAAMYLVYFVFALFAFRPGPTAASRSGCACEMPPISVPGS